MERSKKRLLIITSIVAAPFVAAALAFPLFARARENARRSSCHNNLKQIALTLRLYAKDFDDKLPPVALHSAGEVQRVVKANAKITNGGKWQEVPPFGWCDGIQPYVKSVCVLQCPSETSSPNSFNDTTKRGYTDYWLNTRVAGRKSGANASSVIMNGDGDGNAESNARYNLSALPANGSWPLRHVGGANYSFLDGHVKWLKPDVVSTAKGAAYTFAP